MAHRRIIDVVDRVLTNAGIPPDRLTLDVCESVILEHPRSVRENLHALTKTGVKVALDNFGTGYASLQAIRQLPLKYINVITSYSIHYTKLYE